MVIIGTAVALMTCLKLAAFGLSDRNRKHADGAPGSPGGRGHRQPGRRWTAQAQSLCLIEERVQGERPVTNRPSIPREEQTGAL